VGGVLRCTLRIYIYNPFQIRLVQGTHRRRLGLWWASGMYVSNFTFRGFLAKQQVAATVGGGKTAEQCFNRWLAEYREQASLKRPQHPLEQQQARRERFPSSTRAGAGASNGERRKRLLSRCDVALWMLTGATLTCPVVTFHFRFASQFMRIIQLPPRSAVSFLFGPARRQIVCASR